MTLASGQVATFERVGAISLPEESSTWVALYKGNRAGGGAAAWRRPAVAAVDGRRSIRRQRRGAAVSRPRDRGSRVARGDKRKDTGTDLILRNLDHRPGRHDSARQRFRLEQGRLVDRLRVSSQQSRGGWRVRAPDDRRHDDVAAEGQGQLQGVRVRRGRQAGCVPQRSGRVRQAGVAVSSLLLEGGDAAATELVSGATRGMPSGPRRQRSGARRDSPRTVIACISAPRRPRSRRRPKARRSRARSTSGTTRIRMLQPMQQVRAAAGAQPQLSRASSISPTSASCSSARSIFRTSTRATMRTSRIGTNDLPYRREVSWDTTYSDVSIVDMKTRTGAEDPRALARNARACRPAGSICSTSMSRKPTGSRIASSDGAKVNLTAKLNINFWREDHDTPNLPPAYGSAGWTTNDASVLLYDKYDIWEVKPDGTGRAHGHQRRRPQGRRSSTAIARSIPRSARFPPTSRCCCRPTTTRPNQRLLSRQPHRDRRARRRSSWWTRRSDRSIKASNAERVVFTLARFDEFPDLWVSDTTFRDMKKVSNANPQQAEYIWGKSELMQYINADGKKLRAIIDQARELRSGEEVSADGLHLRGAVARACTAIVRPHRAPASTSPATSATATSCCMPDIVYETGYPGESAEKCVIPAVNTVVAQGYIDPKRIGIQGHSWGGYQITHLITQTNMFAAVQAGASVSNMISAYGGIRWGTGMSRAFQYEKTQSRIGAPPWDAPLQFIENSPIFWVEKVHTPYLMIHNDEDDAVPWYQGDRVLLGDAPPGQGSVPLQLQRRAARPAQARQPEALDRAPWTSSSITSCSASRSRSGWRRACRTWSAAAATCRTCSSRRSRPRRQAGE